MKKTFRTSLPPPRPLLAAALEEGLGLRHRPAEHLVLDGHVRADSAAERKQRLKAALLRWHPDKFEAAHGGKSLEKLRGVDRFDLVTLDLQMNEMHGLEVL